MFEKHKTRKPESTDPQNVEDTFSAPATPEKPTSSGRAAVIGPGIHINGEISGDENLLIEGKVDGKIMLDANEVEIGEGGRVNADVRARIIRVSGNVHGDLVGMEKVIIANSGNVCGNIVTPRMVLEDGAIFKGGIDMDPEENKRSNAGKVQSKNPPEKKSAAVTTKAATGDKTKENGTYSLHGS